MGKAWVDKPWDTGPGSHARVSTLSPSLTHEIVPIQGPSHSPSHPTHLCPRSYLRSHPHHIGKQEGSLTQGSPTNTTRSLLVTINHLHPRGPEKSPLVGRTGPGGAEPSVPPAARQCQGARTRVCSGPSRSVLSGFPSLRRGRQRSPTQQRTL